MTRILQKMMGSESRYVVGTPLGFSLLEKSSPDAPNRLAGYLKDCVERAEIRVFKTHDIASRDFDAITSVIPNLRIFTLRRDLRDVIISRYFYYRYYWPSDRSLGRMAPHLEKFFEMVVSIPDKVAISALIRTSILQNWADEWAAFELPFTTSLGIRLKYETLISGEGMQDLFDFCGKGVLPMPNFTKVQNSETTDTGREGKSRFFREGRAEQWREWFSEEECELISQEVEAALQRQAQVTLSIAAG